MAASEVAVEMAFMIGIPALPAFLKAALETSTVRIAPKISKGVFATMGLPLIFVIDGVEIEFP